MPLAALIIANDQSQDSAALPVAGQTLVEYQARIARAAGAGHIVVLVGQMHAELVSSFDRLRGDMINIDVARDARDAADRIHPEEQLLVFAGGVVTGPEIVRMLAGLEAPALLTLPDEPAFAGFERIDAAERWSGMALLNGKLLRDTSAMLGDWTLAPTLLRTALQAGVDRKRMPDGTVIGQAATRDEAHALSRRLAAEKAAHGGGWFESRTVQPLAARVVPLLLQKHVPVDLVAVLPIVLGGAALLLAAANWMAACFAVQLLAMIPAAAGSIMAKIGLRDARALSAYFRISQPLLCITLGVLGFAQMNRGWGLLALVLAAWAVSALLLARRPVHISSNAGFVLCVMLITSAFGYPLAGLAAVIAGLVSEDAVARFRSA